jgi:hypothetical protein
VPGRFFYFWRDANRAQQGASKPYAPTGDDEMSDTTSNSDTGASGQAGASLAPQQGAVTYDAWLASQPDDVKSMVDGHIGGLKSALQGERERSKTLEKNLRDAASKAEKGSENETRLTELANQAGEATRKAAFYEGAVTAGVANLKLAYLAAVNDDLFKKDGSVDFETMKKTYPELFGAKATNNAGSGGDQVSSKPSMDDFIRAKAGVTS